MTNDSDPNDPKMESDIDAAIRRLERLRRPEASVAAPVRDDLRDSAEATPADPAPEAIAAPAQFPGKQSCADPNNPAEEGDDFPGGSDPAAGARLPRASNLLSAYSEASTPAFADEPPRGSAAAAVMPKTEPKGWFDRRRAPPLDMADTPDPAREMVDLAPVREAMQVAALERADASIGDTEVPVPAAGISGQAFAANPEEEARIAVLLVNLGTPDAAKPMAVRRYLREFLSDRRVIERDTFAWQLVLRGIILPFRPRSKARAYRSIWNQEKDESPLKTITRSQAEKLGEAFAAIGADTVVVDWAMRYGNPSIESRMRALIAQGCERILLLPLYPQYASATTATVCDEAFRVLTRIRNQPSLRVAPPYYADPIYIEAIESSIRAELSKLSFEPEVILVSYHGMPQEYVQKGDPYYRQCTRTTELLRERLGMNQSHFMMTFQSRFGRAEWLQPYTDQTLRKLAKDGLKNVAVVTPGFAADCLETLEEIAIENARVFRKRGGKNFAFIPCLNDSERGMLVIREIVARELKGWM